MLAEWQRSQRGEGMKAPVIERVAVRNEGVIRKWNGHAVQDEPHKHQVVYGVNPVGQDKIANVGGAGHGGHAHEDEPSQPFGPKRESGHGGMRGAQGRSLRALHSGHEVLWGQGFPQQVRWSRQAPDRRAS